MRKLALTTSHLAKNIDLHETDRLIVKSSREKGLETLLVDPTKVRYDMNNGFLDLEYEDKNLLDYDVLLTRRTRGAERSIYELVKSMEVNGKITVDPAESLVFPLNKYLSQLQRRESVNYPRTVYLPRFDENMEKIADTWEFPFVIKPNEGKEGQGVNIILDKNDLKEYTNQNLTDVIIQEYIPIKEEYRVLILGEESLGVCKKRTDSLIKNATLGSNFEYLRNEKIENFALDSVKNHKGDIYGVDVAETRRGELYILECNRSPNFIAFREASGIKVEDKIIEYCSEKFKHVRK